MCHKLAHNSKYAENNKLIPILINEQGYCDLEIEGIYR